MDIKGEIEEIIYQNELNSYTIAVFETEEEETTVVGYLPFVKKGDTLKLQGNFVEHKDYGRQFKIETFEKIMPESLGAIEKYLACGNIKGIGEVTAKRIVDKFGEETIKVLREEYERLAEVKGITLSKAKEISESFVENQEVWRIVGFLEKFGIGVENAKKIYDKLGIDSIEQIEKDPYILIGLTRGVDFKKIDNMALELGIYYENEKRVESGIKYALIRVTNNGNSCTLKQNLIEFVNSLLDVSSDVIEDNLINLKVKDEIVIEERNGEEWVYLSVFYQIEMEIAARILKLENSQNIKQIKNIEQVLEKIEKHSNLDLSEKQRGAIFSINEHNVNIITGGPGTGKTTIIKTIIQLYEEKGKKVVLAAPTGRAAKKMTEAAGKEASTLHRLLGIGKLDDEGIYERHIDFEGEPIDADVVVVDELSMVDMFVMHHLLRCIYQGTKLILVGDSDQLPSVGPGSILKDLIDSKKIPTIHFDKIFRQAAKSKIILNAHRVNQGEEFLKKEDIEEGMLEDFFLIKQTSQEKILNEIISLCTGRLKTFGDYDFFENIQVLTPTKKGLLGTKELNKQLQWVLNPNIEGRPEKANSGAIYRAGDRVMQVKNNYDIYWEKEQDSGNKEVGSGVFNGEMGTIISVDEYEKIVEIRFDDDKVAFYNFTELDQIEHSYAITIHKAQGSEFDVVIMAVPRSAPMLLTRNLLYTGITRAKKLLIILGEKRVLEYMIQNVDSKKRNTGLAFKLEGKGDGLFFPLE